MLCVGDVRIRREGAPYTEVSCIGNCIENYLLMYLMSALYTSWLPDAQNDDCETRTRTRPTDAAHSRPEGGGQPGAVAPPPGI